MNTTSICVAVALFGFAFVPLASATHSSVDCDASGWGDESCSSTNSCNYDQRIGVHAYASDGQADKVHGEFACSYATASCTEKDGDCGDISDSLAGASGVGNCSGYIEDSGGDWNTFNLECFITSGTDTVTQGSGDPILPSPIRPDHTTEAFTRFRLEATPTGTALGMSCVDGACHPVPATCIDQGPTMKCQIVGMDA
jgi:hypothetical protein